MGAESYGRPLRHMGSLGPRPGTDVPLDLLKELRGYPLPVTVGGSNQVTWTLKGSTRPIYFWAGNDIFALEEDLAYTWDATSNNILDSNGADATDTDSVLGVWYMYAAINNDTAGSPTLELRPSQTAPAWADDAFNAGLLGHPGTSKERFWRYVGPHINTTAATPVFLAMTKIGYWWKFAEQNAVIPTASWAAPTNLTLFIPQLAFAGLEVKLVGETGADGTLHVGSSTASTTWDAEISAPATGTSTVLAHIPFTMAPNDTTSPIYGISGSTAGDVHLLGFKDVV